MNNMIKVGGMFFVILLLLCRNSYLSGEIKGHKKIIELRAVIIRNLVKGMSQKEMEARAVGNPYSAEPNDDMSDCFTPPCQGDGFENEWHYINGQWYHIYMYDEKGITALYFDGVQITYNDNRDELTKARDYFMGEIDDFEIIKESLYGFSSEVNNGTDDKKNIV